MKYNWFSRRPKKSSGRRARPTSRLRRFEPLEGRHLVTSLFLPVELIALPGETISVPVQVDNAAGILSADLRIRFQTAALDTTDQDILAGGLWPESAVSDAEVVDPAGVDGSGQAIGTITAAVFAATPLPSEAGPLLTIDFTVPEDAPRGGCYELGFEAAELNEGAIPASTADGSICIPNNQRPEIADQQFSIPENSPQGAIVGQVAASDADVPPQTLSYRIAAGNLSGAFAIDPHSGQITVDDPATLDYENGDYPVELTVQVTDDAVPPASAEATVTVALTNVNEPPTGIDLTGHTVPENQPGAVVGTVSAADPDADDHHTFRVSDDRFEIVDDQLRLQSAISLDYETESTVTFDITATDAGGLDRTQPLTIQVVDGNEAPTDITLDVTPIPENQPGAVAGTLTVTDPDAGDSHTLQASDNRFEIIDGQLKLKADVQLDYEAASSVTLDVTATDSGGLSRIESLVIPVTDVDESTSSLAGYVFSDSNGNQTLDAFEAIPGVKITLTSDGGSFTAWTDDQGRYEFRDLPPGQYTVTEQQPAAYLGRGPDQHSVQVVADASLTDINFLEAGLKPEYIYSRLFATTSLGGNGQAWQAVIRRIMADAEQVA